MSNVIDGPTPHRVPSKTPFDRIPECACDPGSGMSRAEMLARIAELEAQIAEIHASTRRMSFREEWYLEGLRNPPGDYVLMRIGPVTSDEVPF